MTGGDAEASFTFHVESLDPEVFELLFGHPIDQPPLAPAVSVIVDRTEIVSGEPRRPARRRGFRAWLTRANAKAMRHHRAEHAAWVAAGRPDHEHLIRTVIPNARLNLETDER